MINSISLKKSLFSLIFLAFLNGVCPCPVKGDSPQPVFATWDIFEMDKLASIWLIKRFINPDAKIKIYSKGDQIKEGIPFDTPDAKFRRYHNASTYAVLKKHYKVSNPASDYISKIVHDIEINTWERKVLPESTSANLAILKIAKESSNHDEIIANTLRFFDKLANSKKKSQ